MTRALIGLLLLAASPALAQQNVPNIAFDSVPNPVKLPKNMYFGEVSGVALNSKGHIFVLSLVDGGTALPNLASTSSNKFPGNGFDLDDTCTCFVGPTAHNGGPSCRAPGPAGPQLAFDAGDDGGDDECGASEGGTTGSTDAGAADREVAAQTLLLDAIDMLFAKNGREPVQRWEPRRKARL